MDESQLRTCDLAALHRVACYKQNNRFTRWSSLFDHRNANIILYNSNIASIHTWDYLIDYQFDDGDFGPRD